MQGLILFRGGVETQEFFSMELAKTFDELGYAIFFYDLMEDESSFKKLQAFVRDMKAYNASISMFSFNYNGLAGEPFIYDQDGIYWDKEDIPCFNMVLDHPFYYHKYLRNLPDKYYQISIDRNHEAYMKRFFPKVKLAGFIPLAGTRLEVGESLPDITKRPMDIVMTGNYTRPETFDKYIAHLDKEYIDFYHEILDELLSNPSKTLEEVAEPMLRDALEGEGLLSDDDLKDCYANMIFIDLWARFFYRGRAVSALANAGFKVHTIGEGWDVLDCNHMENVICHGGMDSRQCLDAIAQAKISLNVMPWFKDGAHDRIFNSMLNEAVCVSDDSKFLNELVSDKKELVFFHLEDLKAGKSGDMLCENVGWLLNDSTSLEKISQSGFEFAHKGHMWKHRAIMIHRLIT